MSAFTHIVTIMQGNIHREESYPCTIVEVCGSMTRVQLPSGGIVRVYNSQLKSI